MTSLLRDHGLTLLLILAAVGAVSGWSSSARWQGIASVRAAQADSASDVAERVGRANVSLARTIARQDSAYSADSLRWADRDRLRRAEIARMSRDAARTASELRERLDSVGTRLFAEYEATVDSILNAKDAEIADLKAERAQLFEQRETLHELVAGLRREAADWKAVAAARAAEAQAERNARRAQGFLPDFGRLTKPVYIAAGALLGWGGAQLTQSEAR